MWLLERSTVLMSGRSIEKEVVAGELRLFCCCERRDKCSRDLRCESSGMEVRRLLSRWRRATLGKMLRELKLDRRLERKESVLREGQDLSLDAGKFWSSL